MEATPPTGLRSAEASRRLLQFGPNELVRIAGVRWPRELAAQFVHPLALLLWAAAVLAVVVDLWPLAGAIVAVVILNALFAFWEEQQAERAVEALGAYLPPHATVLRDGRRIDLDARARSSRAICSSSARGSGSAPMPGSCRARCRSMRRR